MVTPPRHSEKVKEESMDVDMQLPESDDWLLVHMPSLPLFAEVKGSLCLALRKVCHYQAMF